MTKCGSFQACWALQGFEPRHFCPFGEKTEDKKRRDEKLLEMIKNG
jgi:hypothetical protein